MKKIVKDTLFFLGLYTLCFAVSTFIFVTFGYYHFGDIPTQLVSLRMSIFPLIVSIILFATIKIIKK